MVGKIYAGILVNRVRKVKEDLINDMQGGFRAGSECVGQTFTIKQVGDKEKRKNLECM